VTYAYTINGTDIEQYCDGVRILPEVFAPDRGSNITLPGVDGEYDVPDKDTGSFDFVLETFLPSGEYAPSGTFYENKIAIAKLLYDKTADIWLGRTIEVPASTDVEILVRPVGTPTTGTGSNRFSVKWPLRAISPFWRNQTARSGVDVSTSVTISGDGHVGDAVITFTGGTTPTLTNSTNGDKLTLTDSPGGTAVVVDVGSRTVTQGGSDWDANFEPSNQRWMRFEPGTNTMVLTGGGSVAATFYEKYR